MHCGSKPEWISAWEIDYNRVDVAKTKENREQKKMLLKEVESEENRMLLL
jgi:hypothetical protein